MKLLQDFDKTREKQLQVPWRTLFIHPRARGETKRGPAGKGSRLPGKARDHDGPDEGGRMSGNARQARFAGLGRTMGRVALVGGVAASMALGQLAPVAALAEGEAQDATKGSITINSNNYRKGELSYLGYQVFKAAVGKDGSVSAVQWANDDVKAAVEGVIKAEDASYKGTTAQDAAVWIRAHVQKDAYWLKATDPVGKIAKAISGKTSTVTAKPGVAANVDQGYCGSS